MLGVYDAENDTMKQAAMLAACYSTIPPQEQVPIPSSTVFVQVGSWGLVSLRGFSGEGYNIESTLAGQFHFDQRTTIAILEYQAARRKREKIEKEFTELAAKWKSERRASSSTAILAMHPAYQKIIGMGSQVIPFILADLGKGVDHWFWALRAITRENPVPSQSRGKMREMATAWLEWGRKNGYS